MLEAILFIFLIISFAFGLTILCWTATTEKKVYEITYYSRYNLRGSMLIEGRNAAAAMRKFYKLKGKDYCIHYIEEI